MRNYNKTVVGLDVHKESIVTAELWKKEDRIRKTERLINTTASVEKLVKRWAANEVEFVYEAGPCGYALHRQLSKLGLRCAVIAPGLIPVRSCDRVKTDRRDAEKLARLWRAGELTEVKVPTEEEESARDLVRARESELRDRLRHRHRLLKFLLRQGRVYRETGNWTERHQRWLLSQKFESRLLQVSFESYVRAWQESSERLKILDQQVQDLSVMPSYNKRVQMLRCFKGIDTLSAITILVESQDLRRFDSAAAYMKFTGLTSSEWSSGESVRRGSISKSGNAHLRRVLVESAWSYRRGNVTSKALLARRKSNATEVVAIAKKAQARLHRRFYRLQSKGKALPLTVTAIARELAGFVWSMGQKFTD